MSPWEMDPWQKVITERLWLGAYIFKSFPMVNFLIKSGLWDLHAREFQGFLNKDNLIEISQIEFSDYFNWETCDCSLSTAMI